MPADSPTRSTPPDELVASIWNEAVDVYPALHSVCVGHGRSAVTTAIMVLVAEILMLSGDRERALRDADRVCEGLKSNIERLALANAPVQGSVN